MINGNLSVENESTVSLKGGVTFTRKGGVTFARSSGVNLPRKSGSYIRGISTLELIAFECPMIGGPAVYEARAMLELDIEDTCETSQPRFINHQITENSKQSNRISLTPNPTFNYLNLEFENDESALVEIYDFRGSLIEAIDIPKSKTNVLDVRFLKSGNYLLRVVLNTGINETFKIVINQ